MKKIMLIIISVVILFSACEKQTKYVPDSAAKITVNTSKTQIDPAEEFGGITFGMTKDEVISFLDKDTYYVFESNDGFFVNYIECWYEEQFNISDAVVEYRYKDDGVIYCIAYNYVYYEPEQEQFMNDYAIIMEEILRRYPEEIWISSKYNKTDDVITLEINTENRSIILYVHTDASRIFVAIEPI